MERKSLMPVREETIRTPLGAMRAEYAREGVLVRLEFILMEPESTYAKSATMSAASDLSIQMGEYFAGARRDFDIPLAPEGTEFQRRVWAELRRIPCGETISYAELARRIGDPKAVRAVARANALNPIAVLIPCHRVIGSDGTLTGYAGGLERKARLLELEGAIAPRERRQISLFSEINS